jgi:hypothetical protein
MYYAARRLEVKLAVVLSLVGRAALRGWENVLEVADSVPLFELLVIREVVWYLALGQGGVAGRLVHVGLRCEFGLSIALACYWLWLYRVEV